MKIKKLLLNKSSTYFYNCLSLKKWSRGPKKLYSVGERSGWDRVLKPSNAQTTFVRPWGRELSVTEQDISIDQRWLIMPISGE